MRLGRGRVSPLFCKRQLVGVAPYPRLALLERCDDGMGARFEVFCRVSVGGRVAARDVAARQTLPEVDPPAADLEAILATDSWAAYLADLVGMVTRRVDSDCVALAHGILPMALTRRPLGQDLRLRPVLRGGIEVQYAATRAGPNGSRALVVAFERSLSRTQRPHDGLRKVVFALNAPRIAARHEKERRRAVDHQTPNVSRLCPRDAGSLLDVESQTDEIGHLLAEPRRVVLASTPFSKPSCCGAMSAIVHHTNLV